MPNAVPFAVPAGTGAQSFVSLQLIPFLVAGVLNFDAIILSEWFLAACVFDTACWHTAMDNTSSRARQSVILGYNTVVPRRCTGELIPPRVLEALEAAGRLQCPTRRRLLAWGDGALLGQRGDWRGLYDEGQRGDSYQLDRVRESYFTGESQ
jgi:hypothetical protein